jgi:hypothetical protein
MRAWCDDSLNRSLSEFHQCGVISDHRMTKVHPDVREKHGWIWGWMFQSTTNPLCAEHGSFYTRYERATYAPTWPISLTTNMSLASDDCGLWVSFLHSAQPQPWPSKNRYSMNSVRSLDVAINQVQKSTYVDAVVTLYIVNSENQCFLKIILVAARRIAGEDYWYRMLRYYARSLVSESRETGDYLNSRNKSCC